MHLISLAPSVTRLSAIFIALILNASASFADVQTLPDIQRLMKQGQMSQALEKANLYISTKPKDAQGRFLKGLILTDMGRPTDAIAVFTKLTEDFPELPEPYNNLAVLYAQQKQYDKARSSLEMAIRTHPSYSIAHENLGDVYAKLASQAYDKALQIDSSNMATQTKLSMIKELISTSPKPGVKPTPTTGRTLNPEQAKTAAQEQPKATATVATAAPSSSTLAPSKLSEKAQEPQATAKTPEVKTPKEKASPTTGAESDVTKALQNWIGAWSRKDVKSYLSYYANDFQTPNGMTRKAWETERAQRIDKPGKLQVSIDDIKVSILGDKATAKFRQQYTSSTLKSSTSKTVVLVKTGSKWLIQQERLN